MDTSAQYTVGLRGGVREGASEAQALAFLTGKLNIPFPKARNIMLLPSHNVVLKRGMDEIHAKQLLSALHAAGLRPYFQIPTAKQTVRHESSPVIVLETPETVTNTSQSVSNTQHAGQTSTSQVTTTKPRDTSFVNPPSSLSPPEAPASHTPNALYQRLGKSGLFTGVLFASLTLFLGSLLQVPESFAERLTVGLGAFILILFGGLLPAFIAHTSSFKGNLPVRAAFSVGLAAAFIALAFMAGNQLNIDRLPDGVVKQQIAQYIPSQNP